MRKCINCPWEGKDSEVNDLRHCPTCGDNTIQLSVDKVEVPEEKPKPKPKPRRKKKDNFDLNQDGKVDEKDFSLAAKALASRRKKRR